MWLGRDGHIDYTTIKAFVDSCMGLTFAQSLLATPVHGYERTPILHSTCCFALVLNETKLKVH